MNDSEYDSQPFAELYDVLPQAVVWLKPICNEDQSVIIDFEFTYCNREALKYLQISSNQLSTLRLSNSPTLTDELRAKILQEMIGVYQTGVPSVTNIYNEALNKYARVFRTKLRDGILSVVEDRTTENLIINQQEEQAEHVNEQKSLLDNLLKFSPAGISVTEVIRDADGNIIDGRTILSNDAAEQFLGVPKSVYLEKTVSEIAPDIMTSPLYQMSMQTLETGEPFHTQYYFEPAGKWIELSVSRMSADHLVNIFTDITNTKQTQLQLEKAADRLQAVFNAAQSGMFTFAPVTDGNSEVVDFRFVITNPTFAAYVQQVPETLQGQLGSKFFPGYLHNGVFDMYKKTYLTGDTLRQDIHYSVDGHDLYLDLMSTKIDNEVLVTFTDHTALKQTQFTLEKLVDELKRSNASLEEFAHAASHDLKEPIRKISTFSARLKTTLESRMSDLEQDLFRRMQNATERMAQLVDDLLSYSHLSLTPPEKQQVDLNKKLQLVITDLEVQIEEKRAEVSVEQLPVVNGYPRQLQQLFQNLLSNALKYTNPTTPPQIRVTAHETTGADVAINIPVAEAGRRFHHIQVADNGIGFDPQYAEQIFQMFQRLHGRSEYSGTGVGLSIARKVTDNHHGYIWATGTPGEGAVFHVLLPAE
jgi:signal transduction histidine kinase